MKKDIYEAEWVRFRGNRKYVPADPACEICGSSALSGYTVWFSLKSKRIRCLGCFRPKDWPRKFNFSGNGLNVERMREDALDKERERALQRELGLKLIDIGYKVLATKLHPDHGGSREAMARLNKVRDALREAF